MTRTSGDSSDAPPEVLISTEAIAEQVAVLARRISADFAARQPLLLVGVLKGSFMFLADLARRLTIPHSVDFIALSSYGKSARASGEVRMLLDLRERIAGKHVLIIEDIVDTGQTLSYLLRLLRARKPASLETCTLVQKPARREVEVPLQYVGFEIPDKWVVGYGLDYAERFRTLPYIGYIETPSRG